MSAVTLWLAEVQRRAWPKLELLLTRRTLYGRAKPPVRAHHVSHYRPVRLPV